MPYILQAQQGVNEAIKGIELEGTELASQGFNWFDFALKGGIIMIPILVLLIISIYVFIFRYLTISKATRIEKFFMDRIKSHIQKGEISEAKNICLSSNTPISRMISKGISRIGNPIKEVSGAIETVGKLEIAKLEKGVPIIATTSSIAPMIGFLGTVLGMIRAFYDLSEYSRMHSGSFDIGVLSSGIYTAMVTTVAGLIVGIIANFCYNILIAKVEKVVFNMENTAMEFIDLLNEPIVE